MEQSVVVWDNFCDVNSGTQVKQKKSSGMQDRACHYQLLLSITNLQPATGAISAFGESANNIKVKKGIRTVIESR